MLASKGQGALEYLFLLAGGIIVVIIILLSVIGLTPIGQSFLGNNVQEYEQIDLCTGKTADCALNTDWVAGLTLPPPGLQLQSTTWRDLYIDGFGLDLLCFKNGLFVPCQANDFWNVPQLGLALPITGAACPNVSSTPGSPIYDCAPCDPNTSSCFSSPLLNMCPGGQPTSVCTIPMTPISALSAGIHFPPAAQPNANQEFGIGIAGDILGKGNTKHGVFHFHVQRIKKDVATCTTNCTYSIVPGSDGVYSTPALNYYVSWKAYTGSFQVCKNLGTSTAGNHQFYGCDVPMGGDITYAGCNYDSSVGSNPPQVVAYYINPSNQNVKLANNEGEVVQLDVSPLAATPALPPLPPILSLEVADFNAMPYSGNGGQYCWQGLSAAAAQTSCQNFCNQVAAPLNATNLDFFRINAASSSGQWCDSLANPGSPANATSIAVSSPSIQAGVFLDASGTPINANCGARFTLPTFSGAGNPANYYFGYRRKSGSSASLPAVNSTLRSHTAYAINDYPRGLQLGAFTVQ